MSRYTVVNGIAEIHDLALYDSWLDDDEFKAAVAEADSPERTAVKRLLIEFEADLARVVRDGTVQDRVAEIVERYVADDYVQHDPNVVGVGRAGLIDHFRHMPLGGPTPPPVVGVLLDGDVACVMMRQLLPDPTIPGSTYEWNVLTVFRVADGRLAEHWSAFQKMPPPPAAPHP